MWSDHRNVPQYLKRLPVRESHLVQLGRGDLGLSSIDIRGKDCFLVRFRTEARSLWTMVPDAEWVGILLPLSWTNDYVLNGKTARRNSIFQLDGSREYDVLSENRDALTVGIRRGVLACAIKSISGAEPSLDSSEIQHIEAPIEIKRRLVALFMGAVAESMRVHRLDTSFFIPPESESLLISGIADFFVDIGGLDAVRKMERRSDLRIVRDVISAIHNRNANLFSIAGLCEAGGVKKSRLYEAFDEVYGISPGEYVLKHRLMKARESLLSEQGRNRQIKDVAISQGFLSSGQFARAYRSLFRELPSETRRP